MNKYEKNQVEVWKVLIDLWESENSVKTNKLMMFFAVQSLFTVAFNINSSFNWVVPFLAVLFSLFCFFCIGRTIAFQKHWKKKANNLFTNFSESLKEIYDFFPKPVDKLSFPFYGKMPAIIILLAPPLITSVIWLIILIFVFTKHYFICFSLDYFCYMINYLGFYNA
jgi:hypothetical protein